MKYTLIGCGPEFKRNELLTIYQKYRYSIASAYCYQSGQEIAGENLLRLDEEKEQVSEAAEHKNEHFRNYMEKLNL